MSDPISDEDKPLVSLAWRDVQVTATVLGLGTAQTVAAVVFPHFEEGRLPFRRGVKLPLNIAKFSMANRPTMKAASSSASADAQQQQRQQQQNQQQKAVKKCHICGRGFNKATYLKRHILSHSSVKPFKCNICGWGFFQYCNLKRHTTSHTISGEGFKCFHCRASFSTKSVLSVHMRDAHGDKLASNSGGGGGNAKKTQAVSLLKIPRSADKLPNPLLRKSEVPKQQQQQLESPSSEDAAASLMGGEQSRGFSCTLCQASFDKVSLLNKHIKSHSAAQVNEASR